MDLLPHVVFVLDVKNDVIIYINEKVKDVLDFEQNEVIGNPDFLIENLANEDEIKTFFELKKFAYEQQIDNTYTTFLNLKDKHLLYP